MATKKQLHWRTQLRVLAGLSVRDRTPVELVPGDAPPVVRGEPWHYETRGGRLVHYPNAYARVGWSNLVYVHSTVRLVVGEEWLRAHRPELLEAALAERAERERQAAEQAEGELRWWQEDAAWRARFRARS
jgi:hypothetical protein